MDERVPPVAIHRAWMALLRGEVPEISGLDDSPEATMIRALTGDSPALAHLDDMPGDEPRLVRARVAADAGALAESLAEHPFSPGRRAASVMQAVERGAAGLGGTTVPAAAEAVAALDIDHLRLAGDAGRREAPLVALLPGPWGSLPEMLRMVPAGVPTGRDEVGDAWRAAVELDPIDRDDALAALQAEHPELRVLARVRARIAWGLPPLPGDPRPGPEPPPSDSPLDAPEAPR
jgi:hypothetical protein